MINSVCGFWMFRTSWPHINVHVPVLDWMVLPKVLTNYCLLLPKWVFNPGFGIMVYMKVLWGPCLA